MKRIAIVVQRYGVEINGGAELHARLLARALRPHYEVEVLTSRALDYQTWDSYYPAGEDEVEGCRVLRFNHPPRDHGHAIRLPQGTRLRWKFRRWLGWLPHLAARPNGQARHDGELLLRAQGPTMDGLMRHLAQHGHEYAALIFMTAEYHPSAQGVLLHPQRSLLVPTLHDQRVMYLPHFHRVFRAPRALMYNTAAEAAVTHRLYGADLAPGHLCGVGIDMPPAAGADAQTAARWRDTAARLGIDGPYLLYLGRIEPNKGCDLLFRHFLRWRAEAASPLKLVVAGQAFMELPRDPALLYPGFVSDQERDDLIAHAQAMAVPSRYESLSLVLLEAMARGCPVIVNAECEVLRQHVLDSGVGSAFGDYAQFAQALQRTLSLGEDERARQAERARRYVEQNYSWPRIVAKFRDVIDGIAATAAPAGPVAVPPLPPTPVPGPAAALAARLRRLNQRRLARRHLLHRRQRPPAGYDAWMLQEEIRAALLQPAWARRLQALAAPPLLSVLWLPDAQDRTSPAQAAAALARQAYPHWELLTDRPAGARRPDARVRCLPRAAPGTAALFARYDALLAQARGDYVLLLRSGERLAAPHALLLWAEAAERFGRPPVLYADEDAVDALGEHHAPWLKCDWNQELQRAAHYLGHAWLVRTDLARRAGALAALPPEAVEQALVLHACAERPEQPAVHVPHVLLHRSAPIGQRLDQVPPGTPAQAQALQQLLQRQGAAAAVEPSIEGGVHVRYAVPAPAPLVSLIVPTRNGLSLLRRCIDSLLQRTRYPSFEVLVVDNGSDDPATLEYLRSIVVADARVRVRRDDRPFNYPALNNHALPECRGSVIGLLNNDTEVLNPDWLDEMVGLACRADVGAVGARLWYGNGSLQHAGVVLGLGGWAAHVHMGLLPGERGYAGRACLAQEFSAVTAACLVMRRSVFEAVGGLDEELAVEFNDMDLCLKVRQAGWRVVWTPFAELVHHESATRGRTRSPQQQARLEVERELFARRWGAWLQADPAYHPALSLRSGAEAFSFEPQPRVSLEQPWYAMAAPGATTRAEPAAEGVASPPVPTALA